MDPVTVELPSGRVAAGRWPMADIADFIHQALASRTAATGACVCRGWHWEMACLLEALADCVASPATGQCVRDLTAPFLSSPPSYTSAAWPSPHLSGGSPAPSTTTHSPATPTAALPSSPSSHEEAKAGHSPTTQPQHGSLDGALAHLVSSTLAMASSCSGPGLLSRLSPAFLGHPVVSAWLKAGPPGDDVAEAVDRLVSTVAPSGQPNPRQLTWFFTCVP